MVGIVRCGFNVSLVARRRPTRMVPIALAGRPRPRGPIESSHIATGVARRRARSSSDQGRGDSDHAGGLLTQIRLYSLFFSLTYAFSRFISPSPNPSHANGKSALFWKSGSSAIGYLANPL